MSLTSLLHLLPPEAAHRATIKLMGLPSPFSAPKAAASLATDLAGLSLANPFGMAAGFDKDCEVPLALLKLGFGFAEAGTVTPKPQAGNPKPRLFRLTADKAVINRMGFNNKGLAVYVQRLAALPAPGTRAGAIGANIGANKDSDDRVGDYATCLEAVAPYADYITVNISSPNTPGLRALQDDRALKDLLDRICPRHQELCIELGRKIPIFVKIAPDMDRDQIEGTAEIVLDYPLSGVIATNTTIARPECLTSPHKREAGGLSGVPLCRRSEQVCAQLYQVMQGKKPIIGAGGIANAEDAIRRLAAGADALQIYSAFVYQGPALLSALIEGLESYLDVQNMAALSALVGTRAAELAAD